MKDSFAVPKAANEPQKNVENKDEIPVYFEISSELIDFNTPRDAKPSTDELKEIPKQEAESPKVQEASTTRTSGGYLSRPSQIYVEEQANQESKTVEEPPLRLEIQADEPQIEMQLVMKDSLEATEEQEDQVQQTQPIMMSTVEEPPLVDEAEELKRRAMERIAKLRNLSFNINAADPNNEFETVPAYLRRNMELHNSIANVESFYTNYTVKSNPESNQAEISTINTFLDGKKPD
jgi:cell division protein FtsZ